MADTIRFGKVSNIDYETGCMEITYEDRGDSVTDTESMAGKLRLRAASVPTAAIKAQYHITNTVKYTE